MKSKKAEVEKSVYPINDNLRNIISPSGISYNSTHTEVGENYGKIYAITRYNPYRDYGWLAPLCNIEGTATTIEYRRTDPGKLIEIFNRSINEKKGEQGSLKNESDKQINQQEINDLKKMIERLAVQHEPVGYVNIMLHIQSDTVKGLNDRIKRVSSIVAVNGCNMTLLKKRQGQALKAIAPYGIPIAEAEKIGQRNMPVATFFGGFPMAAPGINDENGYYLGKTRDNHVVILDMWKRDADRVNSNWFISGIPGVGKSTFLKNLFTCEFGFGTRIIIFDPEEEYRDLTKHPDIDGDIINASGGEKGRINPLQIRKAAVVRKEDLDEGELFSDFYDYGEADATSDMALYIQQLKTFFKLYFGKEEFTAGVSAALEQNLIELYHEKNIYWDTDITTLKNTDYPILSELYEKIKKKSEDPKLSAYKRDNYEKLVDLLFSAGEGADSFLWNGPTTLESDADFVDLVISSLLEADDRVKRAQFYNIITWAWNELSKDRQQKVLFGIDEGYLVVDPDYPDLMKYIRNMSKRLRKYEGGLMFITHSVVDVLDPAVKRFGQAIIDSACYKFIMGTDGKNLKETQDLFTLSEKEVRILERKRRGQGILFAGSVRLTLDVDVCDKKLSMFGKAGGR